MSLKETGELIKSILNNVKISWIGMAIIILFAYFILCHKMDFE